MDDLDRRYMQMTFKRDFPDPPPDDGMLMGGDRDKTVMSTFPANPKMTQGSTAKNPPMTAADAGTVTLDSLAGLVKGAVAQVLGLPGDVESLVRLLTDGDQRLLTTAEFQKLLPQLIPEGRQVDPRRRQAAASAESAGEFLPVAPAKSVVTAAKAAKATKGATK